MDGKQLMTAQDVSLLFSLLVFYSVFSPLFSFSSAKMPLPLGVPAGATRLSAPRRRYAAVPTCYYHRLLENPMSELTRIHEQSLKINGKNTQQ